MDQREKRSKVLQHLSAQEEVIIRLKHLSVGDYVVSDRVAIERKTVNDFLQSIVDKRLFNQIQELKEAFEHPIFIIEGKDLYGAGRIHPNAVRGAVSFIITLHNIPVISTVDAEDTAGMIFFIAKHEQHGLDYDISLRQKKKSFTLKQQQEHIVEALPKVGPALAKALLQHFGSVAKVFSATESELMKVEKIGPKKAKEIRELIQREYIHRHRRREAGRDFSGRRPIPGALIDSLSPG